MHVLSNMVDAIRPDGTVLDLQVIRPNSTVEIDGLAICEIDGEPLFRGADAATAAIDGLVRSHELVEQAVDDHDVRKHYPNGPDVIDDFAEKKRRVLDEARVRAVTRPCVIRERCRLRRLRVV